MSLLKYRLPSLKDKFKRQAEEVAKAKKVKKEELKIEKPKKLKKGK